MKFDRNIDQLDRLSEELIGRINNGKTFDGEEEILRTANKLKFPLWDGLYPSDEVQDEAYELSKKYNNAWTTRLVAAIP